mmetsp:Transcript_119486/g.283650  ORF Transcript_119486/g.283650 Transcript_119486/m.283650 type:complete len:328 (-) Transcript_119486:824-1807(-)
MNGIPVGATVGATGWKLTEVLIGRCCVSTGSGSQKMSWSSSKSSSSNDSGWCAGPPVVAKAKQQLLKSPAVMSAALSSPKGCAQSSARLCISRGFRESMRRAASAKRARNMPWHAPSSRAGACNGPRSTEKTLMRCSSTGFSKTCKRSKASLPAAANRTTAPGEPTIRQAAARFTRNWLERSLSRFSACCIAAAQKSLAFFRLGAPALPMVSTCFATFAAAIEQIAISGMLNLSICLVADGKSESTAVGKELCLHLRRVRAHRMLVICCGVSANRCAARAALLKNAAWKKLLAAKPQIMLVTSCCLKSCKRTFARRATSWKSLSWGI